MPGYHLAGPWQAWSLYIGGGLLLMAGVVLAALAFLSLRDALAATGDDADQTSDWGSEQFHAAPLIRVGEQDHG